MFTISIITKPVIKFCLIMANKHAHTSYYTKLKILVQRQSCLKAADIHLSPGHVMHASVPQKNIVTFSKQLQTVATPIFS